MEATQFHLRYRRCEEIGNVLNSLSWRRNNKGLIQAEVEDKVGMTHSVYIVIVEGFFAYPKGKGGAAGRALRCADDRFPEWIQSVPLWWKSGSYLVLLEILVIGLETVCKENGNTYPLLTGMGKRQENDRLQILGKIFQREGIKKQPGPGSSLQVPASLFHRIDNGIQQFLFLVSGAI